jgi:hypothetical protein
MMGGDRMYRMRDGPDAVIAATALYFIVMYTIYCYVDIGWDPRNMILLGTALSIVGRPLTSVRPGVPPLDDEEQPVTPAVMAFPGHAGRS